MAFSIPTYELHVRPNTMHGSQTAAPSPHIFLLHTSPNTPSDNWGSDQTRKFATASSYEWWGLYEIKIDSSWNTAAEGSQFSFPIDAHHHTSDPGGASVASFHIKYEQGNLRLQHQPNFPNHEWTIVSSLSKGVWHSLVIRLILGRTDGTVSAVGHPNGGMGRTRIWVDGSDTPFDSGNVNNLTNTSGVIQNRLILLDGNYSRDISQESVSSFTAGRWASTLSAALLDSSITKTGEQVANLYDGSGVNLGPSTYTTLTSRQDTDFVLPPSLGGGSVPTTPTHLGPWTTPVQYNSENTVLPPTVTEQHVGPWVTRVEYNSGAFTLLGSLVLTAESPTSLTLTPEVV